MEEILNNLQPGEVLHTTGEGTNYTFIGLSTALGVKYSINANSKTLPRRTIDAAFDDFQNNIVIDRNWYRNFDSNEYRSRPCNFSVLKNLLLRLP